MNYRMIASAAFVAVWANCSAASQAGFTQPSVLVTVTALRKGSLPQTVTAFGAVQSSPSSLESITAKANDTVEALYVHEGDQVAAGAPLLALAPGLQTIVAYRQAQAARRDARSAVARTRRLAAQHLATAQDLANAERAYADAQTALDALEAEGAAGPVTLHAPFPAIVMRLLVSKGVSVASGTPLLELARPERLVLRVGVTPADARLIKVGDTAQITALGSEQARPASVLRCGAIVDPASGLVPVDVALASDHLFPGEAAKATITVGHAIGYVVPHSAILVDDRGNPYVVQAVEGKARRVSVQIVATQGSQTAIHGDALDARQALVLSGNYQLDDGMALRSKNTGKESAK